MKRILGTGLRILFTVLSLISLSVSAMIFGLSRQAGRAVSVIGGADGPTSIFLAGKIGHGAAGTSTYVVTGIIILLTVLVFLCTRKKKH